METEVNHASHCEGTALQNSVEDIQRNCTEHEHELDRLGNTGQEYCQCSRDEHGLVEVTLVSIYTTIHTKCETNQQTGCTNHLANLETGRGYSCQQLLIRSSIASLEEVNQVVNPSQPQRVLAIYGSTGTETGLYYIGTAESGVVYRDSNHVMETEWKQETLQSTIDEWCQQRCSIGGVCNPDTEAVDTALNSRPYQSHDDGDDCRVCNNYHRNETLTIEECQYIRKITEVVILVVSSCAYETRDNTYEHTHIQGRCAQSANEVILYQELLAKQGINNCIRVAQHVTGNTEDGTGNTGNQAECDNSCECTAGTLLCPGTTDCDSEQNVKVSNDCPTHILKNLSQSHHGADITAPQLEHLTDG